MSQKIKTSVEIDGSLSASQIANATTDTDKFLVSDGGTIKYRTGAELATDLGISAGTTSKVQHQVKAGVAINKGQAVYVTGADGTNMIVGLASNASESTSSKTMGLLNATVAANGFADVITEGLLAGLNTSSATVGDPIWLGTGGNLIYGLTNKPYAPNHLVFIGIVTRVNANNGEIFVKVQNGFELDEIHDVDLKTTTKVNGHLLGYNGSLWVNKTIAEWLGYTPYNASNPAGYISTYTETDTLASVTARGATTSTRPSFDGGITVNGQSYVTANGYFVSGANGFRWNDSSGNYNNVIMRDNGTTWFRNYLETPDSMRAPIFYDSNNTAFYLDPNSTSNINNLIVAGDGDRARIYLRSSGNFPNDLWFGSSNANHWSLSSRESSNPFLGLYNASLGSWAFTVEYSNNSVNFTADVRSPIYYDANNTGYYLDPNGSSNLNNVTANEFYANGWFRNNTNNTGLYNQANANHFYSRGASRWGITGNSTGSDIFLDFYGNHQTTYRGSVHADTNSSIGFLTNDGGWGIRIETNKNAHFHGNTVYIGADGQSSSNIIMRDGDHGDRQIHCNSNRIGFLNQSGGWGSWCEDNGDFYSAGTSIGIGAMQAPVFYDYNNTAYYWEPATDASHRFQTPYGYIDIGPKNSSYCHMYTDRGSFYFNAEIDMLGNRVLHAGNYSNYSWPLQGGWKPASLASSTRLRGATSPDGGEFALAYSGGQIHPYTDGFFYQNEGAYRVMDSNSIGDYTVGNYRTIADYSSDSTWYMRPNGRFVFANAHDWTQTFELLLPSGGYNNNTFAHFGQRVSNTTNGNFRGVSIRRYISGASDLGDLQAGNVYGRVYYDDNDTAYYFDGTGGTRQSRYLTISGGGSGNNGNELVVGNTSVQYSLQDTNLRPIIQATGAYPVLTLNHTVTSNGSHGATVQFTSNGVGNQFVIGSSGNGSRLDIGTSSSSNWNPHNGIDNYSGTTGWRMDTSGNVYNLVSNRSPIFYDNNDTGFYVDPNGSSNMDTINAARFATRMGSQSPDNSHPGFGIRPFYSWNIGQAGNATAGFSNGISIGSHPGDQAYGFQIVQNMWDDQLYFRRYNSGWLGWRTALDSSNYSGYCNFGGNSVYGGIFYDGNNTGYYVDPAGASNMSSVYANNWFRSYGNTGLYGQDYGVHFYPQSGNAWSITGSGGNVELQFRSNHNSTIRGYVYADTSNNIGFLTSGGAWRLRCDDSGNAIATGDVTAYSDRRVKENIHTIDSALDKVLSLRGVYYTRIDSEDKQRKVGVIAQETLEVLPEVVGKDTDGMYNVAYGNITAVLIEAIKEQQTQIEELKELVNKLINK